MMTVKKVALGESHTEISYNVRHNVGALPTTLDLDMQVKVEPSWLNSEIEKVKVSLDVGPIEADGLDAARLKLADWCDRVAAALRYCERSETTLLPHYKKSDFDLMALPTWLQREFHRVADEYKAVPYDERSAITKQLVEEKHPLVLIPGAIDAARHPADAADDDE